MSILTMPSYTIEYRDVEGDTYPIDFVVRDEEDNIVATVWGWKADDVDVDCDHPEEPEFGDKDECGFCPICGAECIWHEEENEDGKERVVDAWSIPMVQNCLIKRELDNVSKV